jgi:hypothetical protein
LESLEISALKYGNEVDLVLNEKNFLIDFLLWVAVISVKEKITKSKPLIRKFKSALKK